ncbi:MFS transporter [Actinorhabdospora filicis]|nr:MFS transporter [Actinorhabdospora filicis]
MMINRDYTRLWFGQVASAMGDTVFSTGLLIWIGNDLFRGDQRAPLVSSVFMVMVSLTVIVVGPAAGVFVERWNKRRVMLATDLIRAGLMVVFAAFAIGVGALGLSKPPMWLLAVMAVLVVGNTAVAQFFAPARFVLIRDVVPEDKRGRASGYGQTSQAILAIVGPTLAVGIVGIVGIGYALVFNAATFVFSFFAIRAVGRTTEPPAGSGTGGDGAGERRGFRSEFTTGISWILRSRPMRAILVMIAMATLGAGALNALELYFVQRNLHAAVGWLAVVNVCFGAGVLVGAFFGGRLGDRYAHATLVWSSLAAFGGLYVIYSRVGSPWAASAINLGLGIALGVFNTTLFPLIQDLVPRDLLARVGAVINPVNSTASLMSISLSGVLVSTVLSGLDVEIGGLVFTEIDTIFTVGGLLCLGSALYAALHLKRRAGDARAEGEVPVAAGREAGPS